MSRFTSLLSVAQILGKYGPLVFSLFNLLVDIHEMAKKRLSAKGEGDETTEKKYADKMDTLMKTLNDKIDDLLPEGIQLIATDAERKAFLLKLDDVAIHVVDLVLTAKPMFRADVIGPEQ